MVSREHKRIMRFTVADTCKIIHLSDPSHYRTIISEPRSVGRGVSHGKDSSLHIEHH